MVTGAVSYKGKILSSENGKAVSNFILTFVSPALILDACQISYSRELFTNLVWAFGLSIVTYIVSILFSQILFRKNKRDYNIERFSTVYTNCGFIGIPLVQALYGAEGVLYMTSYIAVFNILLWTHGVICMSEKMDKKQLISIAKSPTIYAIIIGITSFCLQIQYPEVIAKTLEYIASLNTPLAMIVAGISVMQSDIIGALKNKRVYMYSFLKMLLIPFITMLILKLFPVSEALKVIITIAASCPVGASVIMFAIRYHKNEEYGAELFAVTTVFSFATMPFLIALCTM